MKSNDLIILIIITTMLFFAHFTKKWSLVSAIMFIMFIMFFFTQYEIARLVCFVAFLVLVILDGKHKGNESVFIKYNVYSEHCVLPKKFVLIVSIIGVICSILSIIGMLIGC
jgi:hypothetical protein